jgi:hypothetical protein
MENPYNGKRDRSDIRTYYTSELDYLIMLRTRFACQWCGTATGQCPSCIDQDNRISDLERAAYA